MKRRRISSRGTKNKPKQQQNPHKIPKQIMTSKHDEVKRTNPKEDARILGHMRESMHKELVQFI